MAGTGFEKEQIGQTHVALTETGDGGAGARVRRGLPCLVGGVRFGLPRAGLVPIVGRGDQEERWDGFGWRVTFGEDFRKPAWSRISFLFV